MVKGLMITHGKLGKELLDVAEKILERKVDVTHIPFDWQGDGSDMLRQIERFIHAHRDCDIVIFTDMFGGSPANIATRFVGPRIEVVSGINLPGLLKFLSWQERAINFKELIKRIEQEAKDGITAMSAYLGEKKHD